MLDALLVAVIAGVAFALFVRERFPADVVAVLVLVALATLGLVTPAQALSGFSNDATLTVAAMFVLSAGLRETGALERLGHALVAVGRNGPLLLLATVLVVAGASAFINNTAIVAVMLPLVVSAARVRRVSPSRLLIPLSYASQIGGVCTLVGTSTNLLVNSLAVGSGHRGFALFDFLPVGIILVLIGTLYLVLVGWWLLPNRAGTASLEDSYEMRDYLFALRVPPDSTAVGRPSAQVTSSAGTGRIVEIVRGGTRLIANASLVIAADDVLLMEGPADDIMALAQRAGLAWERAGVPLEGGDLQLLELVVSPGSRAIGRTPAELQSRWSAEVVPLAIATRGDVRHWDLAQARLVAGDVLLLLADRADAAAAREDTDFIVIGTRARPRSRGRRAPLALAIVAAVIGLIGTGLVSIPIVALGGAAVMLAAGCLTPERAYRAIDLRVIALLAAMLPLGLALNRTGAASAFVAGALAVLPENPYVAIAVLYAVTALLTEFVSNNATAVLMTPVAIALARGIGVDETPFIAAVAFAASTSFSTPIGYQTNTMVYNAGGYAFRDFLRIGLPLNVLFWITSVFAIPRAFPF